MADRMTSEVNSGKESQIFAVAEPRPDRFRPVRRGRDLPSPIPFPKKEGPPLGKKIKKGLAIARNTGLATVAAGTVGLATQHHVEYQEPLSPQGIVRDIGSIPFMAIEDYNRVIEKIHPKSAPIVPETFNSKNPDKQYVQAGKNATPISESEFISLTKDSIKPLETGKFPDVSIVLPVKLSDGQIVEVQTRWVNGAWNPVDKKPDRLAYGKIIKIAKKGTEIIIPENGKVSASTRNVYGKEYLDSLVEIFQGPDGTIYNLVFTWDQDIRQLKPTEIINKALQDGKNNIDLPTTTSIATTTSDNVELEVSMFAYPVGYPKDKLGIPTNFSLIEKEVDGKSVAVFIPQQKQ